MLFNVGLEHLAAQVDSARHAAYLRALRDVRKLPTLIGTPRFTEGALQVERFLSNSLTTCSPPFLHVAI